MQSSVGVGVAAPSPERHRSSRERRYPEARLWWLGAGPDGPTDQTPTGRHRPRSPSRAPTRAAAPGAQADLKTFAALRVHGTCALTAVTAQNTAEVRGVVALDPAFVRQQVEAVLDDFGVRSVKTGMLANGADRRARWPAWPPAGRLPQLVVDPVLVSSTGHPLMEPDGVAAYLERLLPHALVATPNLREAAVLGGTVVEALETVAARVAVGGADPGDGRPRTWWSRAATSPTRPTTSWPAPTASTVLAGDAGGHRQRPRHGLLALGRRRRPPGPGVDGARRHRGGQGLRGRGRWPAAAGWRLGAGHGPLDHFGWSARP